MANILAVYSFSDIEMVINNPFYGMYQLDSEGTGSIAVDKTSDRSAIDIAADGFSMISKIKANNGTVTIEVQQTSPINTWLQGLFNYLEGASTDQWAATTITIRAPKMQEQVICTGGAYVREAAKSYQAQGQRKSWSLMFANIQNLNL